MSEPDRGRRLAARIADARAWMCGTALPFWATAGRDGEYGFAERLTLEGARAEVGYKRLRVQARQVYVFSHATLLGLIPPSEGEQAARAGWDFMNRHGWLPGGGWGRRMGRYGGLVDPTLDLYDQAFGLFAAAWWYRVSDDPDVLDRVRLTLDAIDRRLASPTGSGWLSSDGPDAELLQNPHMHLLEALLEWHDATGDAAFLERVGQLTTIFSSRLFDPATGTLAEYYADDWTRAPGPRGRVIEPGHHYEWVWLLHRAERVALVDRAVINALQTFAEAHGHEPSHGLIYDSLRDDGVPLGVGFRTWPHTEAIKAHLARFEAGEGLDQAALEQLLDNLFDRFLRGPAPGAWFDHLDAAYQPDVDKVPASTLYHLFLAFAELLRVKPLLTEAGLVS